MRETVAGGRLRLVPEHPVAASMHQGNCRVFGVYDETGEWDGIILARLRDRADLDDLAKTTLSLPHVQRTNTMVVLSTVLERAIVAVSEA